MNLRLLWLGIAAFIVALITVLPVSWVAWALPPHVKCGSWSGSVWRGECAGLVLQQGGPPVEIELLRWRLHPTALLGLSVKADFSFRNAQGTGAGLAEFGRSGRVAVEGLQVQAVLDRRIASMLAQGWTGQLEARDFAVRLQGNQIQSLSGVVSLRDFNDGRGSSFGSYRLEFPAKASPPFIGKLADTGGPLQVAADITITEDRRWQLDGLITPRADAPPGLRSRLELLAAPDASGRYRLQSEGTFK